MLALLKHLGDPGAAVELGLGGLVHVGGQAGEGGEFAILGEFDAQFEGDLFHGPALGFSADARDAQADIDGGAEALVEEVVFEVDLAIGDGDEVGGNVGGIITLLGFDDGQGGQGPAATGGIQFGGPFQQAAV